MTIFFKPWGKQEQQVHMQKKPPLENLQTILAGFELRSHHGSYYFFFSASKFIRIKDSILNPVYCWSPFDWLSVNLSYCT